MEVSIMKRKKVLALIMAAAMTFGSVSTAFAMDTNQYKDVLETEDFFKYVKDVVDLKIMEGETADEFGVKEDVTREDVVTYMYKMMKSPAVNGSLEFSDVVDKDYADAVIWADKEELFDGMREGFFNENNFAAETGVTRAEMCQILKNLAEKKLKIDVKENVAENLDAYEDSKDVHTEYVEAVKWAVGNKLLADREEAEGKLLSNEVINKVETAEFLSKLMDLVEDDTVDIVDKEDVQGTVTNKPGKGEKPSKPAVKPNKPVKPAKPESKPENKPEKPENPEKPEKHEHTWAEKEHAEEGHWEDKLIKDAWEETINHEEEGHMETVVLQPEYVQEVPVSAEIGHSERVTVVDKEAWTEEVQHPEEGHYETVVDKEAWEETIHHEEEGHYENGKLLENEQGHYEEVVVKPAWEEEKYVVDKEAWTETINHPEEGHYETVVIKPAWDETVEKIKYVCRCGTEFGNVEAWEEHSRELTLSGDYNHMGYSNIPYHEVINHQAVTEDKWVVDKEAWTEEINHPEEGHNEIIKHPAETDDVWVVDKPAVYEQVWVVDKEAWDEVVKHPAETHEEWVVDKATWVEKVEHPAETHEEFQWVVDVPAVTDFIKHPAVTEDKWVVDKEAWTETIKHEAEYEKVWIVDKEAYTEIVCSGCGESKGKKNK